jgi:hypothetical protein
MLFLRRRTQSKDGGAATSSPNDGTLRPGESSGNIHVPTSRQSDLESSSYNYIEGKSHGEPSKRANSLSNALVRFASHRISSQSDPSEEHYQGTMDRMITKEPNECVAVGQTALSTHNETSYGQVGL